MNRLQTPIPYDDRLSDFRELGRLNLSEQADQHIVVPIADASPDNRDAAVISRPITSDSSGCLLADRHSVGYSDMLEMEINIAEPPGEASVSWPAGYTDLWGIWTEANLTFIVLVNSPSGLAVVSMSQNESIIIPGLVSDFTLVAVGADGRTAKIYLMFLK